MIKSLNILFWMRKNQLDSQNKAPLYCRITVDAVRAEFALKRSIQPDRWEPAKGIVKGSGHDAKSINEYISTVRNRIYDLYRKLESAGSPITAVIIRNLLEDRGNISTQMDVFAVFEQHNRKVKELVNKDFAYRTFEMYETCLKHLREFVRHQYSVTHFSLAGINNEFVSAFDHFLRADKNIANNTTVKYIKNFKKIIRIALANGWMHVDPFLHYKARLKKVDRGCLTQQELDILTSKTFSIRRIEQVKDVFLFQCYTGLAYCDARELTAKNIVEDQDGIKWVKTHRQKTHSPVNVPLLPVAAAILEKYSSHPQQNASGYLLPFLSNQKMNAYLKEIAALCGIDKELSSHLGRHTFATTVTLAHGVSIEAVSKMLSHASINTTKIYARMLDSRVSDEMKVLRSKLAQ